MAFRSYASSDLRLAPSRTDTLHPPLPESAGFREHTTPRAQRPHPASGGNVPHLPVVNPALKGHVPRRIENRLEELLEFTSRPLELEVLLGRVFRNGHPCV